MKKRIVALLLCVGMVLGMLTGCGELTDEQKVEKAQKDVVSYLTNRKLKKDTVVMKVGDQELTAQYYLYWMAYTLSQMSTYYSYFGYELDLDEEISEGVTMADSVREMAEDNAVNYMLMEMKAGELGVALSEEMAANKEEYIAAQDERNVLYFCSTIEDQGRIYEQYQLGAALREKFYGAGGDREATDETLKDYVKDNGIYNCRYILCQPEDSEDKASVAEAKAQCKAYYKELKKLKGDEQLARFMEIQAEANADGNTEEYSFRDSDSLVDGFRETLAELEIGELGMSGKTDYGYFTILRLDVDMTSVLEEYNASDFSAQMEEWREAAEITHETAYEKIETKTFFENLEAFRGVLEAQEQAEASAEAEEVDPADGETEADAS